MCAAMSSPGRSGPTCKQALRPSVAGPVRSHSRGMSLIETLATSTIVAAVSATAVPRLVDLPQQARAAVVANLDGAVRSATQLAHVQCLVQGACASGGGMGSVAMSGKTVELWAGYPNGGQSGGIDAALELSGFEVRFEGRQTRFVLAGAPHPATCSVSYRTADDERGPQVVKDTTGC